MSTNNTSSSHNHHLDSTVSINLTSSQVQFLTQHLQVELTYLTARIEESLQTQKYHPHKLIARYNKISDILTNLGA